MVCVRAEYGYDMDEASLESGLECKDPSLADQSMTEEADINTIVRRFGVTGHLIENPIAPQYAEFHEILSPQEAANRLIEAQTTFDQLPAAVRRRCGGSFRDFLEFADNPENVKELCDLGLATLVAPVPEKGLDKETVTQ